MHQGSFLDNRTSFPCYCIRSLLLLLFYLARQMSQKSHWLVKLGKIFSFEEQ